MSAPLYLVGCGASKLARAAPASQLYTGDLFSKASAYAAQRAQAEGGAWAILSACHGVLRPDQIVEPYDCAMRGLSETGRAAWASRVTDQLVAMKPQTIVILAGRDYRAALDQLPRFRFCHPHVTAPLQGLGIGQQKAWLIAHTAAAPQQQQQELFA